jgi:hypothetical protein
MSETEGRCVLGTVDLRRDDATRVAKGEDHSPDQRNRSSQVRWLFYVRKEDQGKATYIAVAFL